MSSSSLSSRTLHELQELLAKDEISLRDVLQDLSTRIAALNPQLNVYIEPETGRLADGAAAVQGPLRGLPVTVKDNICIRGEATTCASRILKGFVAPYDATVIARLRAQGASFLPRANMDEFAFGSSTENSAYGPSRNPWDPARVPGGSSGGSAAAVAADLAIAALGSDTGGSIRQPAAFCGVVGLKPTYGRVSRYGLVAFASSLDQIGPLTKDVTDAAILLSMIAGRDERDSTSAPVEVPDYLAQMRQPVRGLRVGLPELPSQGLSPEVGQAVDRAVKALEQLGCETVRVKLTNLEEAVATYYVVATAEASSNLARFDGVKYGARGSDGGSLLDMYLSTRSEGFGAEAKRRILLGTYVLSHGYYDAYYLQGMKLRTLIKAGFDAAFAACDVIATPTAPSAAFRLGEKLDDPLQMYLSDIYTISANLAGIPAISLPCGFTAEGLPIGLQLMAAPFQEGRLLQTAYAYEQSAQWRARRPALSKTAGEGARP
jgi:aspartyl-tRNA(Asn)/glutamyl-tRNA(Gln) amidotransferase subunit A